jgi:hypothetical protein
LFGTVADPTKRCSAEYAVGRATPSISLRAVRLSNGAPASIRFISSSRPRRDHTSDPGLKQSLIAAGGMRGRCVPIDITIRFR